MLCRDIAYNCAGQFRPRHAMQMGNHGGDGMRSSNVGNVAAMLALGTTSDFEALNDGANVKAFHAAFLRACNLYAIKLVAKIQKVVRS